MQDVRLPRANYSNVGYSPDGSTDTVLLEAREGERLGLIKVLGYNNAGQEEEVTLKTGNWDPDNEETQEGITLSHDTAFSLNESPIVEDSEEVTDDDDDEPYERGVDYEMNYKDGEITPLSDGDMGDGEDFDITYNYKTIDVEETIGEFAIADGETDELIDVSAAALTLTDELLVIETTDDDMNVSGWAVRA